MTIRNPSVGLGNVMLVTPSGQNLYTSGPMTNLSGDDWRGLFPLSPPSEAGQWELRLTDNPAYAVQDDKFDHAALGALLGTFTVIGPPTFSLVSGIPGDINDPSVTTITISYRVDSEGFDIDTNSLANSLRLTDFAGITIPFSVASTDATDPKSVLVTYISPQISFGQFFSGTKTFTVQTIADTIADVKGQFAAATDLGSFSVTVPIPPVTVNTRPYFSSAFSTTFSSDLLVEGVKSPILARLTVLDDEDNLIPDSMQVGNLDFVDPDGTRYKSTSYFLAGNLTSGPLGHWRLTRPVLTNPGTAAWKPSNRGYDAVIDDEGLEADPALNALVVNVLPKSEAYASIPASIQSFIDNPSSASQFEGQLLQNAANSQVQGDTPAFYYWSSQYYNVAFLVDWSTAGWYTPANDANAFFASSSAYAVFLATVIPKHADIATNGGLDLLWDVTFEYWHVTLGEPTDWDEVTHAWIT